MWPCAAGKVTPGKTTLEPPKCRSASRRWRAATASAAGTPTLRTRKSAGCASPPTRMPPTTQYRQPAPSVSAGTVRSSSVTVIDADSMAVGCRGLRPQPRRSWSCRHWPEDFGPGAVQNACRRVFMRSDAQQPGLAPQAPVLSTQRVRLSSRDQDYVFGVCGHVSSSPLGGLLVTESLTLLRLTPSRSCALCEVDGTASLRPGRTGPGLRARRRPGCVADRP
jgi:hypothetical protein